MLASQFQEIQQRILKAAAKSTGSPRPVSLLAVSKQQPIELMKDYVSFCSSLNLVPVFGENYVQECREKFIELKDIAKFHLIGNLQGNKAREAVGMFECIESVDSMKLATILEKEAIRINKKQKIYIQVNASDDSHKHGCSLENCADLVENVRKDCRHLSVAGLMCITRLYEAPENARSDFQRMRELHLKIIERFSFSAQALALSMGMSSDFEIAIEEGATEVRIGTALFGKRTKN